MRQLVLQVWYTRYHVSFYLWLIGSVLKHWKVSKYYEQDWKWEKQDCGHLPKVTTQYIPTAMPMGCSRKNPNRRQEGGGSGLRTWNFQGYWRKTLWKLQGSIRKSVHEIRMWNRLFQKKFNLGVRGKGWGHRISRGVEEIVCRFSRDQVKKKWNFQGWSRKRPQLLWQEMTLFRKTTSQKIEKRS